MDFSSATSTVSSRSSSATGPAPAVPATGFPNNRWGGAIGNLLFRHTVKVLLSSGYVAFSVLVLKQGHLFVNGAIVGSVVGVWSGSSTELSRTSARAVLRVRKIDSDEVDGLGRKVGFVIYQVLLNGVWLGINTAFSKLSLKPWSAINGILIAAPLMTRATSTALVGVRRKDTADHYAATSWVPASWPIGHSIARLVARFPDEPDIHSEAG